MKFYAPTKTPVHVSLLSGHATLVEYHGTELDKQFYKEAIERGCLTEPAFAEDQQDAVIEAPVDNTVSEKDAIKAAINELMDGTEEDSFDSNGKPNLAKLSEKTGFKVTKAKMEAALAELV